MSPRSKREYLAAIVKRYRAASRTLKTVILDEFCSTCGYHRKHALRLLRNFRRFTQKPPAKRGRRPMYNPASDPLKAQGCESSVFKAPQSDYPALAARIRQNVWPISQQTAGALLGISPASLDRILKPVRAQYSTHGRATTKPGTLLRNYIPVKTNQWDEFCPGFLEADTVAHCGSSTEGISANTLDYVDIATGWTEQRAVWGTQFQQP